MHCIYHIFTRQIRTKFTKRKKSFSFYKLILMRLKNAANVFAKMASNMNHTSAELYTWYLQENTSLEAFADEIFFFC